jgi:hypothetical protein
MFHFYSLFSRVYQVAAAIPGVVLGHGYSGVAKLFLGLADVAGGLGFIGSGFGAEVAELEGADGVGQLVWSIRQSMYWRI